MEKPNTDTIIRQEKATSLAELYQAAMEYARYRVNGKRKTSPKRSNRQPGKIAAAWRSHYQAIDEFFDFFSLPAARYYLLSAMKAAESTRIWDIKTPANLLYFFEHMEVLLSAVYRIVKSGRKIKQVVSAEPGSTPDLTQFHVYCSCCDQHTAWDYFPRNLTAKEYHDPYKALQKFTAHYSKKKWQQVLQYILSHALATSHLADAGMNLELVKTAEFLQKMLEASHLIYVRTRVRNTDSGTENEPLCS